MRETTQNLPTTIQISYKTVIGVELHSKKQIYSNTKQLYLLQYLCNKTVINQQEKWVVPWDNSQQVRASTAMWEVRRAAATTLCSGSSDWVHPSTLVVLVIQEEQTLRLYFDRHQFQINKLVFNLNKCIWTLATD